MDLIGIYKMGTEAEKEMAREFITQMTRVFQDIYNIDNALSSFEIIRKAKENNNGLAIKFSEEELKNMDKYVDEAEEAKDKFIEDLIKANFLYSELGEDIIYKEHKNEKILSSAEAIEEIKKLDKYIREGKITNSAYTYEVRDVISRTNDNYAENFCKELDKKFTPEEVLESYRRYLRLFDLFDMDSGEFFNKIEELKEKQRNRTEDTDNN